MLLTRMSNNDFKKAFPERRLKKTKDRPFVSCPTCGSVWVDERISSAEEFRLRLEQVRQVICP
jgi:hypothetical protein